MSDTTSLIKIACDGDYRDNMIRQSLTIEEAVQMQVDYERRLLFESASYSDTES